MSEMIPRVKSKGKGKGRIRGPRAWPAEEIAKVRNGLLVLDNAKRAVLKATRSHHEDKTGASEVQLASEKCHFKRQLHELIASGRPFTADDIVHFGNILAPALEQMYPGTSKTTWKDEDLSVMAHQRLNATQRHNDIKEGGDGTAKHVKNFSITSYSGVELFVTTTTSTVAARVLVVTWKLAEYARRAQAARAKLQAARAKMGTSTPPSESRDSDASQENLGMERSEDEETESDEDILAKVSRVAARAADDGAARGSASGYESDPDTPDVTAAGTDAATPTSTTSPATIPQVGGATRKGEAGRATCTGRPARSGIAAGAVTSAAFGRHGQNTARAGRYRQGQSPGRSGKETKWPLNKRFKTEGSPGDGSDGMTGPRPVSPTTFLTRCQAERDKSSSAELQQGGARSSTRGQKDILERGSINRTGASGSPASLPGAGQHSSDLIDADCTTSATFANTVARAGRLNGDGASSGDAAHASSVALAFRVSVDPVTATVQHMLLLFIAKNDPVEYRWGTKAKWYRCVVSSVVSSEAEEGRVVQLEFLPPTNARTKRVREFSRKLELMQLLQDGDLAVPGVHLDWDRQPQKSRADHTL